MKVQIFKILIVILSSIGLSLPAWSQHTFNHSVSQYYRDGYLWNPALAGKDGSSVYGLFSSSWSGFDGSAKLVGIAADFDLGHKMGAGLHFTSYSSGIFNRYNGALSYAYKIKLKGNNSLRIGGNLSFYKGHLSSKEIESNGQVDPAVMSFNEKKIRFDGDIGASFSNKSFTFGLTGYNLSSYFKNTANLQSDLEIAELLSSYKFKLTNQQLSLAPLAAYRVFTKSDNIFVGGLQFQYDHIFHTSIYWQSLGSVMGGLGVMLKDIAEVNFFYTGKNKYGYRSQYEAGIKYNIK